MRNPGMMPSFDGGEIPALGLTSSEAILRYGEHSFLGAVCSLLRYELVTVTAAEEEPL